MELEHLSGVWSLDRRIDDHRAGRTGRLAGQARFTATDEGLVCEEEGEMRFGAGPAMQATRRYLWRRTGTLIEIRFADGRFFHAFDPALPRPEAHHACPPDSYHVAYDFSDFPRWSARWRVRGPRKDYTMVTRYRRG